MSVERHLAYHRKLKTAKVRCVIEGGMSADGMTKAIEAVMPAEDATQPWIAS